MLLQLALRVHTLRPFATAVGDATPCVAETRVVVGNGALLTLNLSSFGTETSTLQKAASCYPCLRLRAFHPSYSIAFRLNWSADRYRPCAIGWQRVGCELSPKASRVSANRKRPEDDAGARRR